MADHLLEYARLVTPEGEGLELLDQDFSLEELTQLRSFLSQTRTAIDVTNRALAQYWAEVYGDESFTDEVNVWYLGRTKGKRIIDEYSFAAWLKEQPTEKVMALVPGHSIRLTPLTPYERDMFFDETPTSNDVTIQKKDRR